MSKQYAPVRKPLEVALGPSPHPLNFSTGVYSNAHTITLKGESMRKKKKP